MTSYPKLRSYLDTIVDMDITDPHGNEIAFIQSDDLIFVSIWKEGKVEDYWLQEIGETLLAIDPRTLRQRRTEFYGKAIQFPGIRNEDLLGILGIRHAAFDRTVREIYHL